MLAQGNIRLEDDWAGVQSQLATLPAYSAVQSEADRQELFQQYIAELQVTGKALCQHAITQLVVLLGTDCSAVSAQKVMCNWFMASQCRRCAYASTKACEKGPLMEYSVKVPIGGTCLGITCCQYSAKQYCRHP